MGVGLKNYMPHHLLLCYDLLLFTKGQELPTGRTTGIDDSGNHDAKRVSKDEDEENSM